MLVMCFVTMGGSKKAMEKCLKDAVCNATEETRLSSFSFGRYPNYSNDLQTLQFCANQITIVNVNSVSRGDSELILPIVRRRDLE